MKKIRNTKKGTTQKQMVRGESVLKSSLGSKGHAKTMKLIDRATGGAV